MERYCHFKCCNFMRFCHYGWEILPPLWILQCSWLVHVKIIRYSSVFYKYFSIYDTFVNTCVSRFPHWFDQIFYGLWNAKISTPEFASNEIANERFEHATRERKILRRGDCLKIICQTTKKANDTRALNTRNQGTRPAGRKNSLHGDPPA